MSAAVLAIRELGIRELKTAEVAALFVPGGGFDGFDFEDKVALPAVFYSEKLENDGAFIRFSREKRPLRFERYPKGEILVMTPVRGEGGRLEAFITMKLGLWAEAEDNGIVLSPNGGFKFKDGTVLAPDASWLPKYRWDAMSEAERNRFISFAPDFLIELRSSSDRAGILEAKMLLWMSQGVTLAWMIDPERKLAAIYRQGQPTEILHAPEFLNGEGPVAGFQLEMKRFWP